MSNILFTHSYFYRLDPKQWKAKQPYPPLATLIAAAYIQKNGHDVQLFDSALAESPAEIIPKLQEFNPKIIVIYDDGFNYLNKMCLTSMREAAFELINFAKKAGSIVIVSSSDATDHSREYLEKGADYIIIGEGEVTLHELISSISANEDPKHIAGLVFFNENEVFKSPKRAVLKDLDVLPLPAWHLVALENYRSIWLKYHGYFSLNMVTTRGCPFKCNWCAKPIYGNRYNSRSPAAVVNEMKWLIENYQVDHFWFCDDIFGLKPGWLTTFSDLVNQKKLKFKYKVQTRADLVVAEGVVDDFARSGLETAWIGAESGSQQVLNSMDKGITVGQIYEARHLLKSKKIKTGFFLQFGYPGEMAEDIQATLRMLKELIPDEIGVSVSYPLPGTLFYEKVKQDLKTKSNWTDSDDLAVMFKGTYQPVFYKMLHRYIHKQHRLLLILDNIKSKQKVNNFKINKYILLAYYFAFSIFYRLILKLSF